MTTPARYDSLVRDKRGSTYYRDVPGKSLRVSWWWNRSQQLWCVYVVDREDNQIGAAQYCHKLSVPSWIDTFVSYIEKGEEIPS